MSASSAARLKRTVALTIALVTLIALTAIASLSVAERAVAVPASTATVPLEASPDSVPFYVVQPSMNGEPEFLFAIAQRFLGNGDRFTEIFDLNEGRPQPGGGSLTEPSILNSGWVLQLPADAKGEGVQFGPIAGSVPVESPLSAQVPAATAAPEAVEPASESRSNGVPVALIVTVLAIIIVLAIAGAYLWLRRRKRPAAAGEPSFTATDRSASWTIDSALKIVTSACEAEQIAFPGLYFVVVDSSSIHLHLSVPSAKVPVGWTASPDGRRWSATLAHLQTQPVPAVTNEQFAAIATLGTTDTGRLLIDFNQANGVVSVDGSSAAVTDVVEGWLTELTSNPWSGSREVVRLASRGNTQQQSLDDFLTQTDHAETGVVVIEASPTRAQGEAIRALSLTPDFTSIVIVKGAFPSASWAFTARDGVLTSDFLPDIRYEAAPAARVSASA